MKILLLLIFLLPLSAIFAQEGLVKTYYENGYVKSEINYSDNIRVGEAKFYYDNGKLKEELNYVNGKVDGVVKQYNKNGTLSELFSIEEGKREGPTSIYDSTGTYLSDITYLHGKRVIDTDIFKDASEKEAAPEDSIKNFDKTIKKVIAKNDKKPSLILPPAEEPAIADDPAYYMTAEIMPQPVGGIDAIQKKLVYPQQAKDKGIEGTVEIRVFIDKFGEVERAEVVKGIGYGCDEAARIAVFYTQFRPGIIKGKPVKIQMTVPVEFKLNK